MVDQELLDILVCPENHTSLKLAEPALIDRLNAVITAGKLKNRGGQFITEKIDGALVREDGQFAYPIRDDIPIMLIDESIPLTENFA